MTFNKGLHVPEIGLLTEISKLFIKVKLIKVLTYSLLVLPKNPIQNDSPCSVLRY